MASVDITRNPPATKAMALCQGPMSDADHARMVEFCCPQCLASVMGRDDDPIPKCARCRIKMLPDSDEPKCPPPSTILGRMRGNPAYRTRTKVDAV